MKKKIVFLFVLLLACAACTVAIAGDAIGITVSEPINGKVYVSVEKDAGWEYTVSASLMDHAYWDDPEYNELDGTYVFNVGEGNGGDLWCVRVFTRKVDQKDSAGNTVSEYLECNYDPNGVLDSSERTTVKEYKNGGREESVRYHSTTVRSSVDTVKETNAAYDQNGIGTMTEQEWLDGVLISDYKKDFTDAWNYTVNSVGYDKSGRKTHEEATVTKDSSTRGTISDWSYYDDGTLKKETKVTKGADGKTIHEIKNQYDEKGGLTSGYEFEDQGAAKKYTWKSTESGQPATRTGIVSEDGSELYTEYDEKGTETKRFKYINDTIRVGSENTDRKTEIRYDASGNILGKKESYTTSQYGSPVTTTNYYDANGKKTGTVEGYDYSASGFSIEMDETEIAPGDTFTATYSLAGGSGRYSSISYNVCGSKDGGSATTVTDTARTLTETSGTLSFNTRSLSNTYYDEISWMYYFTEYYFEITIEDELWGTFTVASPTVSAGIINVGASGWVCIDGKWYYGDSAGNAHVGMLELGEYGLDKYYLDENGVLQFGWFQDNTGAWYYSDDTGKIEDTFYNYDTLIVPDYVDSTDNLRLFGVKRDFILQCTPGSAAEQYAKEHGIAYSNGVTTVSGSSITNLNEKVKWVVDTYTTPDMSDMEKAKRLHDWVIYNTIYDQDAANAVYDNTWRNYANHSSFEASGPLLYGTGVCDGYTKAYQMLLNQAGIENRYITGPVGSWRNGYEGEGEEHAWNLVKIDGSWYHVDCTFDDQGVGYEYFLENDEYMWGDHHWTSNIVCDGDYAFSGGAGWKQLEDGSWIYRAFDWAHHFEILTGAHVIDGVMYFFDTTGRLVSGGWCASGGTWYYIDETGCAAADEWRQLGGVWYYFQNDGSMADGWQYLGGIWYYFDGGAMSTGWKNLGGTWYYFEESGAMATGWLNLGGVWYCFDDAGAMATGWRNAGGVWYYMDESGAMATGWRNIGGTWYYFENSGAMATGWLNLWGVWYWFDGNGAMATGWKEINGSWEMFADSGEWLYTWDGK